MMMTSNEQLRERYLRRVVRAGLHAPNYITTNASASASERSAARATCLRKPSRKRAYVLRAASWH
jgi:hypothetical protein